jgi:protease-4
MPISDDSPIQSCTIKTRRRRVLWWTLLSLVLVTVALALLDNLELSRGDRIAVIRIEGLILDAKDTVAELKRFGESSSVKAIVLRIDSPGGGVVPSQEIHDAVQRVRSKQHKTVVASMGTVAASGGYYIATAADRIVANPGTLTGSIGVIMELVNLEGLLQKVGVESVVVKSGHYKDIGSPFRKMSPDERRLLQALMDDIHNQFIEAVAKGRSLEVAAVRTLADGRILTGRQARDARLVDELGDLEDAVRLAADLAGIEGEPQIIEPKKRFSIREFIESRVPGFVPRLDFRPGIQLKYLMAF